jgi:hypothetical protein
MGSPAAGFGKATKAKNYFAGKVPQRTHANCAASPKRSEGEDGQVEPVLGGHPT